MEALDWISRKYSFNKKDIKLGNRLPKEMAESPPSETLEGHVDVAFGDMADWRSRQC